MTEESLSTAEQPITMAGTELGFSWAAASAFAPTRQITVSQEDLGHATVTKAVRISETQSEEQTGADFWSRLSKIEAEAFMSGRAATDAVPAGSVPLASRIDESDLESRSLLTTSIRRLAPVMHAIIASKASRTGLEIMQAYFDVDRDEDENTRQLVVIVRVNANASQALAFWASLDYELDRWLVELPPNERQTITNRLGLRFAWNG